MLEIHAPDICLICETWADTPIRAFKGYDQYQSEIQIKKEGVLILIKRELNSSQVKVRHPHVMYLQKFKT